MTWAPIDQDPPHNKEVMLWLRAEDGTEEPIGSVIATHLSTEMGNKWCEKSVAGNINTGLRQDLITHYKLLDGGPDAGDEAG